MNTTCGYVTKYLNNYFLILMSFLLFSSCSENEIDKHLSQLHKINFQVDTTGWNVKQSAKTEREAFFSLEKRDGDTLLSLSFSNFRKNNRLYYIIDGFSKSFVKDEVYFEWSVQNFDTIYYYSRRNTNNSNELQHFPIDSLNFEFGKYYFLDRYGRHTMGQQQFFLNHKDSLLKIRGNVLVPLPEAEFDSSMTSPMWFLDESNGQLYDLISGEAIGN